MRNRLGFVAAAVFVLIMALLAWWRVRGHVAPGQGTAAAPVAGSPSASVKVADTSATRIHAHNLLLQKGPNFRIYVRWLSGYLGRSKRNVIPSFDDPQSFYLEIQSGVIRANIGDLGNFLNTGLTDSPVKNIKLSGDGDQIKLTGTVKKMVPLPIQLIGTISATADNRIQVHVTKLDVLKIPMKGLLGLFKVSLADLFKANIDGLQVTGNDLFFDTQKLFPPPHIRGKLTRIHIANPDLEEVYGNAAKDVERVEQWRNFLSLKGGTLDFGKLTMNDVDLMMIDISTDPWFDLDLVNYQAQLTNGYTRMTPQAGLQIFMPDRRDLKPVIAQDSNIDWFKNRNIPPPPQITAQTH